MQDLDILNNSYLIIGGPKSKKSEVARLLSKELKYIYDFTPFLHILQVFLTKSLPRLNL